MKAVNKPWYTMKNGEATPLRNIPVLHYSEFKKTLVSLLKEKERHCVNYFAYPFQDGLWFIAAIADDSNASIYVLSHRINNGESMSLDSITPEINALHIFEREIFEKFNVQFTGHPWLKPVRYPADRANKDSRINDYPFYQVESHELHEVGVGPVHAGIIEPGHFRFICNGEEVLHLEIQLGWQHRGVEKLMTEKKKLLQRTVLSESIAGDTAIGHSLAFAQAMESLSGLKLSNQGLVERSLALELERIALHTADISALCTDVAYNLGASIFGILRTGIINFTQSWCGNRLGKGMIRVGGTHFPFTPQHAERLSGVLEKYEFQFHELARHTYQLASVENRFDNIGTVTESQMRAIGAVGMAARMAGLRRDIRYSHPFAGFNRFPIATEIMENGDVYARFLLRRKEIETSITWIKKILAEVKFEPAAEIPPAEIKLTPESLVVSLTEGWRGEICHCAITDAKGELSIYKVKDPSLHNWKALELSLRNLEISDFPINNKSYNLSYCGFDL
ncbi:MAG: NADH-quinone oxidoreductase subunit C [Bacteroidales bacterium]|nr:NADH-quinone oxidoreductase subunit C [Bacteroidales bacterium]